MSKEKKSLLNKLFKNSGGCSCGIQIVEEDKKTKETDDKSKQKNNNIG